MLEAPFHYEEDVKAERAEIRSFLMKCAVVIGAFCLLMLLASQAIGAPVFRAQTPVGPVALKLHNTPCKSEKVKAHFPKVRPEFHDKLRAATLTYGGKDWESCWVVVGGFVNSIDEEGAFLEPIDMRAFKDDAV